MTLLRLLSPKIETSFLLRSSCFFNLILECTSLTHKTYSLSYNLTRFANTLTYGPNKVFYFGANFQTRTCNLLLLVKNMLTIALSSTSYDIMICINKLNYIHPWGGSNKIHSYPIPFWVGKIYVG